MSPGSARREVVFAIVVAATAGLLVLLVAESMVDAMPEAAARFGRPIAWALSGFVASGAGAVSWLVKKRARAMALRFGFVTTAVASAVLVLLAERVPASSRVQLEASDRLPLVEARLSEGTMGVEHPRLRFRLPHPDAPFVPAPWIEREAYERGGPRYREEHALYAFQGPLEQPGERETTLMLDVSTAVRVDREALEALTAAALGPIARNGDSITLGPIVEVSERCLRRSAGASLASGGRLEVVLAVFREASGERAMRLAVTVVSERGGWSSYLERLELPCG